MNLCFVALLGRETSVKQLEGLLLVETLQGDSSIGSMGRGSKRILLWAILTSSLNRGRAFRALTISQLALQRCVGIAPQFGIGLNATRLASIAHASTAQVCMLGAPMPVSSFLAALAPQLRDKYTDRAVLEEHLVKAQQDAATAWPSVEVSPQTFASYLGSIASRSGEGNSVWRNASDLYLCCACASADPAALEAFESKLFSSLDGVLRRVTSSDDEIAEVKQVLRTRLFVPGPDQPAKIETFLGRSRLRAWLRAAAVREAIAILRHHKKHTVFEADELLPATDDIELDHFREIYTLEFKTALQTAFSELSVRDRNVLRQVVLDGLSVGQVAKLHGVHRGSASRWLSEIREQLSRDTKRRLGNKLQLPPSELSSIMRLVDSRVDISLERILHRSVECA